MKINARTSDQRQRLAASWRATDDPLARQLYAIQSYLKNKPLTRGARHPGQSELYVQLKQADKNRRRAVIVLNDLESFPPRVHAEVQVPPFVEGAPRLPAQPLKARMRQAARSAKPEHNQSKFRTWKRRFHLA